MNIKKINDWEVLTASGWQDFEGIKKTNKDSYLKITYKLPDDSVQIIKCSKGHQLLAKRLDEVMFCFAEMLEVTDQLLYKDNETFCVIENIEDIIENIELYDLINVKNGYEYIAGDIVNHNCAHVEGIDELWLGLQPTLSTGGSAILISSPSGVGTLFHKIWVEAHVDKGDNEEGRNGFHPIELPWTVHPERDQKWFELQRQELVNAVGERAVNQELLCSFQSSGDTFIKGDVMDHVFSTIRPPLNVQTFGRDEIWIWQPPQPGVRYVIGADVARGDGDDYSAFNLINTQTNEIVVDFKGKPPPDKFAELLLTYGSIYNNALICQELNNVGVAAAIKLKDSKYSNLYYEKFMKNMYMSYVTQDVGDELPGFTTNANNRVEILAKLENLIRNKKIVIYSKRMFEELQTFIWKGNKPQAQKNYHDDLVMSLAIGCQTYEATDSSAYDSINFAMSMLKGMSRDTKSMNSITGEQKTQVYQVKLDQDQGPITKDLNQILDVIKKGNLHQQNQVKKTPHNLMYGPYKWLMDD